MNKGLLYKDFFEIKKFSYLIIFMFLIVIEPKIIAPIVMLYACFLSYTIFEIDEKNRFDIMLCTMPISARDFVISRYLIGFILFSIIGIWIAAIPSLYSFISGQNINVYATVDIAKSSFCMACIFQSIVLPIVIKFGVIKSKLYLLAGTVVVVLTFLFVNKIYNFSINNIILVNKNLLVVALILSLISMISSYLISRIKR
ncbi:MAG: ABC-2 transporter permease [Anaerococcus vaginalis]|uniref:ABC-2 transporter permease n=1 Tax=Anaerococcus vaginalis TaxID=33037 RepID=UPI00290F036D|nr:ABC-2 transporter permease [Anaerococcus vaginalis]MDU5087140.1 ABC-2 transporter permease [Anaerococcus vaginalis]